MSISVCLSTGLCNNLYTHLSHCLIYLFTYLPSFLSIYVYSDPTICNLLHNQSSITLLMYQLLRSISWISVSSSINLSIDSYPLAPPFKAYLIPYIIIFTSICYSVWSQCWSQSKCVTKSCHYPILPPVQWVRAANESVIMLIFNNACVRI